MKLTEKLLKICEAYGDAEPGLTSKSEDGHQHGFDIDLEGNGRTISTMPDGHKDHEHKIVNNVVQEADGHDHNLV